MSRHRTKQAIAIAAADARTTRERSRKRTVIIGTALMLCSLGGLFIEPVFTDRNCPGVDQNAYRMVPLDTRPTDVHKKLEYCAFPYHFVGRSMVKEYDSQPWSDFCGSTEAEVEARIAEFEKPALDAQAQCKREFGASLRHTLHLD